MSVIWSGITEGGQIVPIQVDEQGRVISTASAPDPLWIEESGNLRPANPGATIVSDGAMDMAHKAFSLKKHYAKSAHDWGL